MGSYCKQLGVASAAMIAVGYPGELIITGDLSQRWMCWFFSMMVFLTIVYTLLIGLADATAREDDRDQLVHIPRGVFVPHVRHWRCAGGGRRAGRLLRIGHHLQVRCWPLHLPDHGDEVCQ